MPVLWYRGRLSWTAISLFLYGTLCVLAFDYVWRRINIHFALLLLLGFLAWVVGSGIILVISRKSSAIGRVKEIQR